MSKMTASMLRARSKASRLRTRMPFFADTPVALTVTSGMARPSACGQAMTRTVTVRVTAKLTSPRTAYQVRKVMSPAPTAM